MEAESGPGGIKSKKNLKDLTILNKAVNYWDYIASKTNESTASEE